MNEILPIGEKLDGGRYTVDKVLGRGGFSITYLATNRLNRKFTIKEFFIDRYASRNSGNEVFFGDLPDEQLVALKNKFEKEGRLLLKIETEKHPNIVKAIDFFSENNTHYLVLEYIDGQTLKEVVENGGPLKKAEASRWLFQIGSALTTLHRNKIYHLDVKPANIIIDKNGQAVLIDFGLGKEVAKKSDKSLTTLAYSGGYASPEQENGTGKPNAKMDIYAFAATCFFMLTGTRPDNQDLNKYEVFSGHNLYLKNALKKGMATNPTDRPESIYDLLNLLKIENSSDATVLKTTSHDPNNTTEKKAIKPTAWGIAVLIAGLFALYYIYFPDSTSANPDGQLNSAALSSTQSSSDSSATELPTPNREKTDEKKDDHNADHAAPPGNSPAEGKTAPRYSHAYEGYIQKIRSPQRHAVRIAFNLLNQTNEYGEPLLAGECTVKDVANVSAMVKYKITGYLKYDDDDATLKIETKEIMQKNNLNFCGFSGHFVYKKDTKNIRARFQYQTGTAQSNSCSPYRTNSEMVLSKKN